MKPLASLLVTTYNVENYVDRALKSALAQTYPNLEIIAVDDHSSDDTWEKLQQFKGKVILIRHKRRRRVPAALNTALNRARGGLITRLDGDDVLYPKLIEKEVKFLQKHPEIGFVYCDYDEVDEQGNLIRKVKLPEYSPPIVHQVDYIAMGNMIRKECYEVMGNYDEKMKKQEHYDWSIRLAQKFTGGHLAERLFAYTRHPRQATANLEDLKYYTELIRKKYGLKRNEVVRW